jgi:D-aminopeptidase
VRLRDLGIAVGDGDAGPLNAITDVPGVRVGHTTIIEGDGPLITGKGPIRTGVSVIVPHEHIGREPLFAGAHRLNGNGELTGLEWIRESGMLTTPIALTNTHSVGVVRDALIAAEVKDRNPEDVFWSLPVVGETWDGRLNDINGMHVKPEHVQEALTKAQAGEVEEGNVGGGTGMVCHGFKGGIGTSSRVTPQGEGGYVVGVLVQANHGRRHRLRVNGIPVGEQIAETEVPLPTQQQSAGSIIVVIGTDAPLLPNQCERLAQRAGLGVARTGGVGEHSSGDLFICFSTGNAGRLHSYKEDESQLINLTMLSNNLINGLFDAVIDATEEAILNALLQAETMTGRDGVTAHKLPPGRLQEIMAK